MATLSELVNKTLENFDPKKDKIATQNNGLPTGQYDIVVNGLAFHVYESGYECISVDLKVIGGDYDGQHEFINWNVDPEYTTKSGEKFSEKYKGLFDKAIRTVLKFACVTEIDINSLNWTDQVELAESLQPAKGKQFVLSVTKEPNKSGKIYPDYEFISYDDEVPF